MKEKKMIKKTKIQKVSTGIKELDKISEGGFEKDSTNLIIGESGSGKTIFGVQFLIEGAKKGEKCLYITFEERKKNFYSNLGAIGFDLENLEKKGNFFFLEYTPEKVKTMLEEGGGIIETLVLSKKITRIAIDSMTSFGLLFRNDLEKRQSLLSLFNMLKKWQCTTLLTYEGNVEENKIAPDILELESDSIIVLYFLRGKKKRERYLEILKMRGTKHSSQLYNFSIEKNGVIIDKKPSNQNINDLI